MTPKQPKARKLNVQTLVLKKGATKDCGDCDGKGHYVQADDFTAHDCPSCKGTGQVAA